MDAGGRVVNACSKRAPALGANLGVLALLYSINERMLCYARDKDDTLNPILGASLTGPPTSPPAAASPCRAARCCLPCPSVVALQPAAANVWRA